MSASRRLLAAASRSSASISYKVGGDGCTTWTPPDSEKIFEMAKDRPTTLYIYPELDDIDAVAQGVKAGRSPARAGLYWNASCLREIRAPKFWLGRLEEAIVDPAGRRASPFIIRSIVGLGFRDQLHHLHYEPNRRRCCGCQ